jgi:DNA-binding transcriptional MocR family regulator
MTSIPFTRGVPSADMLPVSDIEAAAVTALREDGARALSYSPGGYMPLREWIAARHGVDPARVLLVNGSLQGVAFVAQHLFLGAGQGLAMVEEPTYDRTLISLRTFGAEVVPVPLTAQGVDTEQLERILQQHPSARLLYVIPTFQNPAGVSLPEEGRRRVVELAQQYGVLVMEDDPYGLLRFEGVAAPTLLEIDGGENVIYSSSFTKTVAPGIRTGYMVLPPRLVAPLAKLSENTYIAPNTFAEATLAAYCRAGRFEPNVERVTEKLRARRDAMEAGLREHFPHGARWTTPEGGYFYWVDLPPSIDTGELLALATERGVPYVKGSDFCAGGGGGSSMRLAFSAVSPEQIGEGIARLGALMSSAPAPAGV